MKGRKPTPTRIKQLMGNPGKRPLPPDEPNPKAEIPVMPQHLIGHAADEWNRITKELHEFGLVTQLDRAALSAYCQTYSRWVQAEALIGDNGVTSITSNGTLVQSPYVGIANQSLQLMYKYLVEFGMTPSSRTRVAAVKRDDDNPYRQLQRRIANRHTKLNNREK